MVLRALNSVLLQTFRNIEIIVVDDSPNDYPSRGEVRLAILNKKNENRDISIKYIAHEKNMGACVARNTGIHAAKGEYIAFLDDDDEWLPEKIEKQMAVIKKSNAALVYCGNKCKNDETGKIIVKKKQYYRGNVFQKLLYYNFIESTSYPLIRKDCLINVGLFDPLMQSAQDYDLWLRIAEEYTIDYVPEPLVIYHEHNGERITVNPRKKIAGLERINYKYSFYLNSDKELWWKRNIGISTYYSLDGNLKQATTLWRNCVKKCPEKVKENFLYFTKIVGAYLVFRNNLTHK